MVELLHNFHQQQPGHLFEKFNHHYRIHHRGFGPVSFHRFLWLRPYQGQRQPVSVYRSAEHHDDSGEVTMVPQFIIFRHLDWINTFYPLIVPSFFAGAFNVFLIRQFVMSIPKSLDEAAMIDGMGHPGIYWKIIMPLTYPILAAIAIFSFSYNWGNFMGPLIYINDPEKMPLALGVQLLTTVGGGQMPPWNLVMIASLFLTIPMVLVYLFGQRYVYEANISGGSSGIK